MFPVPTPSRIWRSLSRLDWRAAAGEVALVVVGVLIALAVDAWWEGRGDRERERAYLRQLLSDVRATEERLEESISRDSVTVARVTRFMDAAHAFHRRAEPGRAAPPADSLVEWGATEYAQFVPLTGTYTALVEGDGLRLLRSDSLRFQVIALAAAVDAAQEVLRHTEAQTWRNLEHADLARWRNRLQRTPRTRPLPELEPGTYLSDPEVLRTFTLQRVAGENRLGTLRGLREPLASLRRTIARELGPRDGGAAGAG